MNSKADKGALAPSARWTRETWIEFAVERLRSEGPSALTLEALCAAARRTRGSFYHHFETVGALSAEVARRWRRTETDEIGALALAQKDPRAGLRALARRSEAMDHGLEIGVRALAAGNIEVADLVREADHAREAIIAALLVGAYGLEAQEADDLARVFHSLQLAGQMRAPDDVAGFSASPARRLTSWLEARAADEALTRPPP